VDGLVGRGLRLAPGAHLFRHGPGESWIAVGPDESMHRVELAPPIAGPLLSCLLDGRPVADARALCADPDGFDRLAAAFADAGFAVWSGAPDSSPDSDGQVLVDGAGPLAAEVLDKVARSGRAGDEGDAIGALRRGERPAAIVSVAGWLPDTRWRELDRLADASGTPWTRAAFEGSTLYLGPMTVWGTTAGYQDVRTRRLAASDCPDELEAYWASLSRPGEPPPPPVLGPAELAAAAGFLVSQVLGHLAGRLPTHAQVAFDPAGFTWASHPVLPIPRNLMTAGTLD